MKPNALVILNGVAPKDFWVRKLAKEADLVIAADGGANIARRCKVRPDLILGDLDSVTASTLRYFSDVPHLKIEDQNRTDFQKALDFLVRHKYRKVTVVASTAKRIDYTLANFALAWNYVPALNVEFVGQGWRAILISSSTRLRARKGNTVSLIPYSLCKGVTLTGLLYPLSNATLRVGDIAVSNVVMTSPLSVDLRAGKLLCIELETSKDAIHANSR